MKPSSTTFDEAPAQRTPTWRLPWLSGGLIHDDLMAFGTGGGET